MEIKGKVVKVLPEVSGNGANGEWKIKSFVVLEQKDQYPKPIAIRTFKDFQIGLGDIVNVSVNIESKEHNERWFTDVVAWKYDVVEKAGAANEEDPTDDLPF